MKVLIITNNLEPTSGWGRSSLGIINELKRQNIDLCIASEQSNDKYGTQKIYPPSSIINLLLNIFIVRKLSKSCNIIHSFDGWPYGVYGYFSALGTKKKLFTNGVGTYSVAPLYTKVKGFLLKKAYRRAQNIFTISAYVKNRILEHVKLKNIEIVHMGITLLPRPSIDQIRQFQGQYGVDNHFPILLTVGEIKERKGQLDTLRAVNLLKQTHPNILYMIVGGDKDLSYINKIRVYAEKNNLDNNYLIISDIVDDVTLSCCYESCHIFLLNSNNDENHIEGFGLVILEANQFGKPVIGSRNCGIEDAINDGVNGYLVEQKNPTDICLKVNKILSENIISRERVISFYNQFSWSKTVKKYIEHYDN